MVLRVGIAVLLRCSAMVLRCLAAWLLQGTV
jgi:hypothetical protein